MYLRRGFGFCIWTTRITETHLIEIPLVARRGGDERVELNCTGRDEEMATLNEEAAIERPMDAKLVDAVVRLLVANPCVPIGSLDGAKLSNPRMWGHILGLWR
jgi:hypothetical protein